MPPAVLTDNFNLLALLPEIALLLGACIVLIADAVAKDEGKSGCGCGDAA